jgi:hypothetical protein
MSRSNWVRVGALGALILLVAIAAAIWASVDYEFDQTQQRQSVAPKQTYTANEQARDACSQINILSEYLKCVSEYDKAQREEEREQHDLQAQQDNALLDVCDLVG